MARIAIVEKDKCNPIKCGNFLCMRACPVNRMDEECIIREDGKIVINEELCTGCGICVHKCPFNAISIINLPEALTQDPIHQYGQNGFRLYSLPTPIFGKVVGILGKNGIGKSTAIKILADVLNPNFGDYSNNSSNINTEKENKEKKSGKEKRKKEKDQITNHYDRLIKLFKGTESQYFFEKVKAGDIKVAYKLQQVDLIPKQFDGKVKELLEKIDEKNQLKEITQKLGLTKVLNHNIKDISGGELQRVAIAATVLKKANVYIFDEPTSYLDIKQRIIVSKFIRNLADENTAVLVVEHDLIILDYMTDLIHLMYGKESGYGIISQPKATRTGINIYLDGFLKEENIRFRNYKIRFDIRPPEESVGFSEMISWNKITKTLGSFSLESEKGLIHSNRTIGILGENGIGKTTFVKILAEVIKADSGEIKGEVKVAYKSQYIESDNELVAFILRDAIANYTTDLIDPLNLKHLLDKNLSELSGGQLQRVAIAHCLSQEANLFLLDEPSAYLDVEQRLIVAKVISDMMYKKNASALVVDHDILFIDYLSNNLMVFTGEPAVKGKIEGPFSMAEGMNLFLKDLNITMRRDKESSRPRINKPESVLDREQKSKGKLYYS